MSTNNFGQGSGSAWGQFHLRGLNGYPSVCWRICGLPLGSVMSRLPISPHARCGRSRLGFQPRSRVHVEPTLPSPARSSPEGRKGVTLWAARNQKQTSALRLQAAVGHRRAKSQMISWPMPVGCREIPPTERCVRCKGTAGWSSRTRLDPGSGHASHLAC